MKMQLKQVSFCPPPFRRKTEGHSFRHSVLPSFRPSVRPSFHPPNIVGTLCAQLLLQFYADSFETLQMLLSWSEDMQDMRNSPYSFMPILSKLYRYFYHGLKICMRFGYNPDIIFCHFFRNLNLVIF